ncbi:MAG: OsmC family protein [Chlamydiae bacterium]|nr:OsmC family protein [Chlamydiota bacterium]MBI3277233.1 OsmC family protein [Chlamydiota bacterium]
MVEILIEYEGDLHCSALHGPSKATLSTDAPVDNQGRGESFSPTDLLATALGTCMATMMGIFAKRRGIELKGMKVRVEKHMQEAPRRVQKLDVNIYVPVKLGEKEQQALEAAALSCPVHKSLHPAMEIPIHFHYPENSVVSDKQ